MKFFKFLLVGLKTAYRWDRAVELATKQKWAGALDQIEAFERLADRPLGARFSLLKAVVLRQLGDPIGALRCTIEGHRDITVGRYHSEDEKKYLQCYASVLGLRIMVEQSYTGRHEFIVDYNAVNLDKVYGATKKVFPLRGHPLWQSSR